MAAPDDSGPAVGAVRAALLTVAPSHGADVDVLATRVAALLDDQQGCRHAAVGAALPGLILDLHAAGGRRAAEVYRLRTLLHVQGTQAWLRDVGAPLDLGWQAAVLARQAAERLGEPVSLAVSAFGTAHGLLAAGSLDSALECVRGVALPSSSPAAEQVSGMLAFTESLVCTVSGNTAGAAAALAQAEELASRTGEGNELWFGFGPTNVAVWRMACALETGDHARAAEIAAGVRPELIPSPQRRAAYWGDYGRALAGLRGRVPAAVGALREAERISAVRLRDPASRKTLAELVIRSRRGSVGSELRGMAYRAGLPV